MNIPQKNTDFTLDEFIIVTRTLKIFKDGTEEGRSMIVTDYESEPYRFCWSVIQMMGVPIDKLRLMEIMLQLQSLAQEAIEAIKNSKK